MEKMRQSTFYFTISQIASLMDQRTINAIRMPTLRSRAYTGWRRPMLWRVSLERDPLTGEPDAGDPPVRFGGRGAHVTSLPYRAVTPV